MFNKPKLWHILTTDNNSDFFLNLIKTLHYVIDATATMGLQEKDSATFHKKSNTFVLHS